MRHTGEVLVCPGLATQAEQEEEDPEHHVK